MTLVEILAVSVGPSIAKSILKLWLKDKTIASEIGSALLDLLKSRTSDILAQQKGKRQFEEIGEKVALSLLQLFESEGAKLDEGDRNAVAIAVAETLDKSVITPDFLAQRDLEPTALATYLIDSNQHLIRFFSETARELYRRIIFDASRNIVDIASQLPSFTERTLGEVLKRENELISITHNILEEVSRIREGSQQANRDVDAIQFETEYRLAIVRKLDELELFGVDVSKANRRHRLSVAYITLGVAQNSLNNRQRELTGSEHHKDMLSDDEDANIIVPVDQALVGTQRLLIRGSAGSGKTTLLQWIAVRSASENFEGNLADWNKSTIPFFIRLRQCVETGLPAPEEFPNLVVPAIADKMPKGWVHEMLTSGRAVVLVDGVDEVLESQRPQVRKWLKELIGTFKDSRFVVTSRPSAIEEGWLDSEGFADTELQPMELPDVLTFIEHWHDAVRNEVQEDEERTELAALEENLKREMRKNRQVRELATLPLLCAMICALHRERHKQLPSDRIELYEACVQMLIERRDIERGIALRDYPRLTYRQKRALLEDLAYWLLTNGWSIIPMSRAEEEIERGLANMPGIPQGTSKERVLKLFVDRSGIVREPVPDQMDFAHRTFLEFLAAQAAINGGNIGQLIKNAHDDQWRDVVVLAAGLAGQEMREEIIKGLILRGDKESRRRHQLHLLAVACLETSVKLSREIKTEVQYRLSKLVPPKNMTEAKALATAGELAVPYLRGFVRERGMVAAACIRTLSLIGGEAAFDAIEGYRNDWRQTVINELLKAWDTFDRNEFAQRVLSYTIGQTETLRCQRISSLEGIQILTNLRIITVWNSSGTSDLTPLIHLKKLKRLDLYGCRGITTLEPLEGLSELTDLFLDGCELVKDLSPLLELKNLHTLGLWNCTSLTNIQPLADMKQLITLRLFACENLKDITSLEKLSNLNSLYLGYCQLENFHPLGELVNLLSLDLGLCPKLTNLSFLTKLTNLTYLRLNHCPGITDLSPLASLTHLGQLDLRYCLKINDFTPLIQLSNLKGIILDPRHHIQIPIELKKKVHISRHL